MDKKSIKDAIVSALQKKHDITAPILLGKVEEFDFSKESQEYEEKPLPYLISQGELLYITCGNETFIHAGVSTRASTEISKALDKVSNSASSHLFHFLIH